MRVDTVAAAAAATVRVPVSSVFKGKDAQHVDDKAEEGHDQELVRVDFRRLVQPLDCLEKDVDGGVRECGRVDERRKRLHPAVAVRERAVGRPLGHDGRDQPKDDGRRVKAHVHAIANETQRVGPEPVKDLPRGRQLVQGEQGQQQRARARAKTHVPRQRQSSR